MTIIQDVSDLTRAALRYFGTRLCSSCMRWVANWNRGTLTASDGAHLIARLHELHDLREENQQLRAKLDWYLEELHGDDI